MGILMKVLYWGNVLQEKPIREGVQADKTGEEATRGHALSSLGLTHGSSVASTAPQSLPVETSGLALCTSYHSVVSCRLPWLDWGSHFQGQGDPASWGLFSGQGRHLWAICSQPSGKLGHGCTGLAEGIWAAYHSISYNTAKNRQLYLN